MAEVVVEVRADGEAPFHLVQQAQQLDGEGVEPATFRPRTGGGKPFVVVDFTARQP